jgi:hypothetical protein
MVLHIKFGRRIPRNWFRRQANVVVGMISFQENLWQMIKQSINLAKRKAQQESDIIFLTKTEYEKENINSQLEWFIITIQGNEQQEADEYKDIQNFYKPFGKVFKKDFEINKEMSKMFNTKILSMEKLNEAYKQGYGSMSDKNIAAKMLELGILLHYELEKDYDNRQKEQVIENTEKIDA